MLILSIFLNLVACDVPEQAHEYEITSPLPSYTVKVGNELDFKALFTIKDVTADKEIAVTDEMISAEDADFSTPGMFTVTCTYENAVKSVIVIVEANAEEIDTDDKTKQEEGSEEEKSETNSEEDSNINEEGSEYDSTDSSEESLEETEETEEENTEENTEVDSTEESTTEEVTTEETTEETTTEEVTTEEVTTEEVTTEEATTEEVTTEEVTTEEDTTEEITTEEVTTEEDTEDPTAPTHAGTKNDPYTVADAIKVLSALSIGEATEMVYVKGVVVDAGTWKNNTFVQEISIIDKGNTSLTLLIKTANPNSSSDHSIDVGDTILLNGYLRKYYDSRNGVTVSEMGSNSGRYTYFTVVSSGSGGGSSGGGTAEKMPAQTYNPNNHTANDDILHDAIKDYIANDPNSENNRVAIGLPAQGEYSALVVPVQFTDDHFTQSELADLEIAFNGDAQSTGWHSVSSYYKTSSFNKLSLNFDIYSNPVTMPKGSSSYETSDSAPQDILDYVLDTIDSSVDLSKYDTNDDGYIDAVYLIYSVPMDYESDESNFWAFVTWHFESDSYDGVKAHYYLFASVDFMYEDTEDSGSEYAIDGLKLNATTYIHETGHLLELDDYYDYSEGEGSDKGLGNADMMDYTIGDHNVYSKLMLGWVTPTVVTSTQDITISSSTETGQFIMVLLDYDGTYFSEYLLIDLYTATGLNEMHAGIDGSLLYDGEPFGARIYHVSSSIDNPFSDDYPSFTDNNNSMSDYPLIKLVEADGDENYESDVYNGYRYASYDDLWQTGDSLSSAQPGYTRNDGKLLNFDITFTSVSATSATVSITFN